MFTSTRAPRHENAVDLFEPIELKRKERVKGELPLYHIYTRPGEFIAVEAQNAQIALSQSGVTNAYRVECVVFLLQNVVLLPEVSQDNQLETLEVSPAAILPDDVTDSVLTTEQPSAEGSDTTTGGVLSTDDVEKLLNGQS